MRMTAGSRGLYTKNGAGPATPREIRWLEVGCKFDSDDCSTSGDSWLGTLKQWIPGAKKAWNSESKPKWRIHALNEYFFSDLQLRAVSAARHPSAMTVRAVVEERTGNCLGFSLLYLIVAEEVRIPLLPVLTGRHVFVRYDDAVYRQDIETTRRGRSVYALRYRKPRGSPNRDDALRVLTKPEFLGLMYASRAAFLHIPREDWRRARQDVDRALMLFPSCSYALHNLAIVHGRSRFREEMLESLPS